jgi:hypothetical protein
VRAAAFGVAEYPSGAGAARQCHHGGAVPPADPIPGFNVLQPIFGSPGSEATAVGRRDAGALRGPSVGGPAPPLAPDSSAMILLLPQRGCAVAAVTNSASGLSLQTRRQRPSPALSARLKDASARHLAELASLRQALAEAHGESLQLRRRLAAYEG